MKLVTFLDTTKTEKLGIYDDGRVMNLANESQMLGIELPADMNTFLAGGEKFMKLARRVAEEFRKDKENPGVEGFKILAPVPHPRSCRDAYAFRQHVAAARRNRGVDMIPEFDQFPIFYFTNHNAISGPGEIIVEKDHLLKLDFELELAVVIGKYGKNIDAGDADEYIAGFTIMNDWSARQLQMEEMKLNLGPAKGKDFSTSIGPWLVTKDELEKYKIKTNAGNQYDLQMKAYHNDELISEGNAKDMTYTFAEIIERVSYGVEIFPGEVIGSGTVGTGCYLELNGTRARLAKEKGEEYTPVWIEPGDIIELEITGLGKLSNKVTLSKSNISILAKKRPLS